jgi:lipopolysaccharide biosynthesis protein
MPHNPSELVWKRLLAAGVPFIKVGLFRVNHYGLDLEHVLAGLEADTPYDVGLIRAHLQRVGRS